MRDYWKLASTDEPGPDAPPKCTTCAEWTGYSYCYDCDGRGVEDDLTRQRRAARPVVDYKSAGLRARFIAKDYQTEVVKRMTDAVGACGQAARSLSLTTAEATEAVERLGVSLGSEPKDDAYYDRRTSIAGADTSVDRFECDACGFVAFVTAGCAPECPRCATAEVRPTVRQHYDINTAPASLGDCFPSGTTVTYHCTDCGNRGPVDADFGGCSLCGNMPADEDTVTVSTQTVSVQTKALGKPGTDLMPAEQSWQLLATSGVQCLATEHGTAYVRPSGGWSVYPTGHPEGVMPPYEGHEDSDWKAKAAAVVVLAGLGPGFPVERKPSEEWSQESDGRRWILEFDEQPPYYDAVVHPNNGKWAAFNVDTGATVADGQEDTVDAAKLAAEAALVERDGTDHAEPSLEWIKDFAGTEFMRRSGVTQARVTDYDWIVYTKARDEWYADGLASGIEATKAAAEVALSDRDGDCSPDWHSLPDPLTPASRKLKTTLGVAHVHADGEWHVLRSDGSREEGLSYGVWGAQHAAERALADASCSQDTNPTERALGGSEGVGVGETPWEYSMAFDWYSKIAGGYKLFAEPVGRWAVRPMDTGQAAAKGRVDTVAEAKTAADAALRGLGVEV